MISLNYIDSNESSIIKKIEGSLEIKNHLKSLGLIVGAEIRVVNTMGENLIISVKDKRVAVSKELAKMVLV